MEQQEPQVQGTSNQAEKFAAQRNYYSSATRNAKQVSATNLGGKEGHWGNALLPLFLYRKIALVNRKSPKFF